MSKRRSRHRNVNRRIRKGERRQRDMSVNVIDKDIAIVSIRFSDGNGKFTGLVDVPLKEGEPVDVQAYNAAMKTSCKMTLDEIEKTKKILYSQAVGEVDVDFKSNPAKIA